MTPTTTRTRARLDESAAGARRPPAQSLRATTARARSAGEASNSLSLQVVLSPARFASRLAVGALILVALHAGLHTLHFRVTEIHWLVRDLFDLDAEQAFGTWFSSAILMTGALAAALCSRRASSSGVEHRYWLVLAAGFVLLSIDEVAGVHEAVNTVTDFSWAIPAGLLSLVIGVAYLPFLAGLPLRTRTLLMYAGLVYLAGAIGVELTAQGFADRGQLETLTYALNTALEEGLEMGGAILFVYATLDHLASDL